MDLIATEHMHLALGLAQRVQRAWPRYRDEIESAALLGLVLAARRYDPARGVPYEAYVRVMIRRMIQVELRRIVRHQVHYVAAEVEPIGREPPVGSGLEAAEEAGRALAAMRPRQAAACRLVLMDGLSWADAGRAMGLHERTVRRLVSAGRAVAARTRGAA